MKLHSHISYAEGTETWRIYYWYVKCFL